MECCFVCLPKPGPDGAPRHVAIGGAARKLGAYVTFGAHRHVTAIRKSRRVPRRRSKSEHYQMHKFTCCQAVLISKRKNSAEISALAQNLCSRETICDIGLCVSCIGIKLLCYFIVISLHCCVALPAEVLHDFANPLCFTGICIIVPALLFECLTMYRTPLCEVDFIPFYIALL